MDAELRQLDAIREAAFGLALRFAKAAEAEDDLDRMLRLYDAFHRGGASVRLSIALAMRLRREASRAERRVADHEPDDVETPEPTDADERPERFDERDRERETVSLPILLRTLEHVADDAQALLPQAAELPTLREILDQVRGTPATASPRATSPAPNPLRARLSGGTAPLTLAPPRISGLPGTTRRSTGPP